MVALALYGANYYTAHPGRPAVFPEASSAETERRGGNQFGPARRSAALRHLSVSAAETLGVAAKTGKLETLARPSRCSGRRRSGLHRFSLVLQVSRTGGRCILGHGGGGAERSGRTLSLRPDSAPVATAEVSVRIFHGVLDASEGHSSGRSAADCCICPRRTRCLVGRLCSPWATWWHPTWLVRFASLACGCGSWESVQPLFLSADCCRRRIRSSKGDRGLRPQAGLAFPAHRVSFPCATSVQAVACSAQTVQLRLRCAGACAHCGGDVAWFSLKACPMDTFVAVILAVAIAMFFVRRYLRKLKKNDELARRIAEKAKTVVGRSQGFASPHRRHALHRLRDLYHGLSRGRRAGHAGRQGGHRQRTKMHRPRALRRGLSRRRHHHGDGQSEHGRRHALPDRGVRDHHREPVHRRRTRRAWL